MIPKIIHQIWLGNKMPEKFQDCIETVKTVNSDYEHVLWTDDNLDEFPLMKEFAEVGNIALRTDVLRVMILKKYGGIYIDADMEALKPLNMYKPLQESAFVISMKNKKFQNCFLGSTADNPNLHNLLNGYMSFLKIKKIPPVFDFIFKKMFVGDFYIEENNKMFVLNEPDSVYFRHHETQTWKYPV